jgi:hypothetical protein
MQAEENRGLFGFHNYTVCPDCQLIPDGWQMWGQNGHCQGSIPVGQNVDDFVSHRRKMDPKAEYHLEPDWIITYRR